MQIQIQICSLKVKKAYCFYRELITMKTDTHTHTDTHTLTVQDREQHLHDKNSTGQSNYDAQKSSNISQIYN